MMDPAQFSALISFPFATLENRLSVIAQCCMKCVTFVDFFFKAYGNTNTDIQTWMDGRWSNGCATNRERERECHLVSPLVEVQILVVARETPFRSWGVQNINTRTTQIRNSVPKRESVFSGKRFKSWSFVTGDFGRLALLYIVILTSLFSHSWTNWSFGFQQEFAFSEKENLLPHNPIRKSTTIGLWQSLQIFSFSWFCLQPYSIRFKSSSGLKLLTGLVMMYSGGAPGMFLSEADV